MSKFKQPGERFEDWYYRAQHVPHLTYWQSASVKKMCRRAFEMGRTYENRFNSGGGK